VIYSADVIAGFAIIFCSHPLVRDLFPRVFAADDGHHHDAAALPDDLPALCRVHIVHRFKHAMATVIASQIFFLAADRETVFLCWKDIEGIESLSHRIIESLGRRLFNDSMIQ